LGLGNDLGSYVEKTNKGLLEAKNYQEKNLKGEFTAHNQNYVILGDETRQPLKLCLIIKSLTKLGYLLGYLIL